ncbi:MAG: alpha-glucuronidase [Clostridia bacterium]|nr:alpha-glucuronidase [Clostridia bacterium]
MALREERDFPEGLQTPQYPDRMVNCWDNMDGSIERGYAGKSLWFSGGRLQYDEQRILQLSRLLASVGINVICLNNVNVHEPAQDLIDLQLPDLSKLAALFRPFGIRLMISIDFSQPMRHDLSTADPLSHEVQAWWKNRVDLVYREIPDLYGFLVKADSEHRPGPFTYGRTHAEGANMLADALASHGGKLVWRCFVYNCTQDWRDRKTDRPCAAYDTYQPLDGQFRENVILQVKHGPFDFQVREPISPLLLSMQSTNLAMELQLAQEYTGQQIDLYTMVPMWKELFQVLPKDRLCAIAAVSNLGASDCFTGHPLALCNLFGYGKIAWNPSLASGDVVRSFVRLSYDFSQEDRESLTGCMLESRAIYEKYTANLGLCWMITPNQHYGPNPDGYEYQSWGTYHKADRNAVGIDRTGSGTGYTLQYPEALRELYANVASCPDELLLFFHRLPYTFVMRDGRTLMQRLYDDHFEGLARAEQLTKTLCALPFPERDRQEIQRRAALQVSNAREWCDIINTFFHRFSGIPDEMGRTIYD